MKRGIIPTHEHTDRMIAAGYSLVAGVDEVGRGALAGPVVAAAVILTPGTDLPGVRDSKLVKLAERERLAIDIKRHAAAVGIGWATAAEVDAHGLTWAVATSGKRALEDMNTTYDAVILDGNHNYLKDYCVSEAIVKADSFSLSVAAASIVAKVARDNMMNLYHQLYPQFGFNQNVGYGTALHMSQLQNGISVLHRRSFAPMKALPVSAS